MRTRIPLGRVRVWAGVASVLAVVGCGKEPTPVAQVSAPADPPAVVTPPPSGPTTPPPSGPTAPPTGTTPVVPILPGGVAINPFAGTPPTGQGGTFVPPSSPTFTQPDALPGPGAPVPAQPPVPPTQPPAQPPMPGVQPPPAAEPPPATPPKPEDPPATPPTETTKPAKVEYPTSVGGKNLEGWLAELVYTSGGPVQKDDQMRETAVKMIPSFGPDARKPSVGRLIDAIRADPDPGVQIAAITVVSNMGFDMRDEVRPVLAVLQQRLANSVSGNIVRMYCVRSLASFGPDAVGAVPHLKNVCIDPSWETRREVAIALSLIGATPLDERGKPKKNKEGVEIGPNKLAIETLLDYQLKDRSVTVRLDAAKSLLALGPPVPKTPAEFAELTKEIQKTIADLVKFESGAKGAPTTNKYGGRPDRGVYAWALVVQIMYDDRKAADNLKELAKLVAEPEGPNANQVRLFAIQAIGACGVLVGKQEPAVSEKVIGAVTDALRYTEPVLVYTAMTTLALLGKDASAAVPTLQKIAAQEPKVPEGAPKGTPPDDSLQRAAKQTIEVIKGTRKMEDFGKEELKAAPPKPAEPKPADPKPAEKK
jgi:hypothetical protein